MINDVACFNFDDMVWTVVIEDLRNTSSYGCTSLPNKEVLLSRSEISSSAESITIDAPPSSGMLSSSTDSCVSPDIVEGYSVSAILKPGTDYVIYVFVVSYLSGLFYLQ